MRNLLFFAYVAFFSAVSSAGEPLEPWMQDVKIALVSPSTERHSIHTYYVANPESPDGRYLLYFTSTHPAAYVGEICILERATGLETVLVKDVHTEDAHRVACQQWLSGGRLVAYHEVIEKKWRVAVVNVQTLEKTIIATDRQVGFGQPSGDLLPIYGCHWNPGPHRDLEFWDAKTEKITKTAKISDVEQNYAEWMKGEFAGKTCSIFFPVLSPDLKRVFFKIASGNGGDDFMSKNASHRQGLVCYDLEKGSCFWHRGKWGHPAWMPDSRGIFEAGNITMDIEQPGFKYSKLKNVPNLRGSHPSVSPDGSLMVTDGLADAVGGKAGEWSIMIADIRGEKWKVLHTFDQTKGARSWRRNDPHPVFSADGKRIYYNVSDGPWSRLYVAESQ